MLTAYPLQGLTRYLAAGDSDLTSLPLLCAELLAGEYPV